MMWRACGGQLLWSVGFFFYTNPVRDVSVGHGPVRKHVRAILRGIAGKVVCWPTLVALVVRACYDVMW
jgi:hypothetical protein